MITCAAVSTTAETLVPLISTGTIIMRPTVSLSLTPLTVYALYLLSLLHVHAFWLSVFGLVSI